MKLPICGGCSGIYLTDRLALPSAKDRPINDDVTALTHLGSPLCLVSRRTLRQPVMDNLPYTRRASSTHCRQLPNTVSFLYPETKPFEQPNNPRLTRHLPKETLAASGAVPPLLPLSRLAMTLHLTRRCTQRTTFFWLSFSNPNEFVSSYIVKYFNLQEFQQHFLTIMPAMTVQTVEIARDWGFLDMFRLRPN